MKNMVDSESGHEDTIRRVDAHFEKGGLQGISAIEFITTQSTISTSLSERVSILIDAQLRLRGFYWLITKRGKAHDTEYFKISAREELDFSLAGTNQLRS